MDAGWSEGARERRDRGKRERLPWCVNGRREFERVERNNDIGKDDADDEEDGWRNGTS